MKENFKWATILFIFIAFAVIWECSVFLLWLLINLGELIMIIPFTIWWVFSGKFYGYKLEFYLNRKYNNLFDDLFNHYD